MNIESADVIRLIEQFLKEHNLHSTLEALQTETGISLNTVDNTVSFKDDIVKGNWDAVLASVEQAHVPQAKRIDLYEQIITELADLRDISPARALLRQTEPMELMRSAQPDRYLRLEQLLSRTSFDSARSPQHTARNESRRLKIAEQLLAEVCTAPASRLLTLLGHSIKWQQLQGILSPNVPYDLFFGRAQMIAPAEDKAPCKLLTTIKFPKKQCPNSLAFSPDGAYLATGSADGFIELWNPTTGKIADELKYQADGALMMMEDAVTALAFSDNGEMICSGAKDGKLKVWRSKTGSCAKRFPAAHSQGVTCLAFSRDHSQILSGGHDNVLRIHGLKSAKMLKELRGHSASVTSAIFSEDMANIISTSDDGSVRIWDTSTTNCIHTVVPDSDKHGLSAPATHSALAIPGSPSEFVVCTKSPSIYILAMDGSVRKSITVDKKSCNEFLTAAVTPHGKHILAVSDMSILHCIDITSGNVDIVSNKIPNNDVIGIACHPVLNIAAFFSNDRRVPIWTA
ncbi:hypothetical protein GGH17_003533 [Coemansia sp. RSA 788]|nr:hypothetical protein LPJ69_000228 [Coemansia sp. RSA 1752]KAJ1795154.1 hypothetical protein LPJ67_000223 [Coemansia sp. RSA 1938]KAJ2131335.1 hypothetical protein GGH17_003533 [Coemansia sp. RSA 788]